MVANCGAYQTKLNMHAALTCTAVASLYAPSLGGADECTYDGADRRLLVPTVLVHEKVASVWRTKVLRAAYESTQPRVTLWKRFEALRGAFQEGAQVRTSMHNFLRTRGDCERFPQLPVRLSGYRAVHVEDTKGRRLNPSTVTYGACVRAK